MSPGLRLVWCHHLVSYVTQSGDSPEVDLVLAEQSSVRCLESLNIFVELFFGGRLYADYDLIGPGPGLFPVAEKAEDVDKQGDGDDECQGDGYS